MVLMVIYNQRRFTTSCIFYLNVFLVYVLISFISNFDVWLYLYTIYMVKIVKSSLRCLHFWNE